jgi:hypothetical protein
MAAIYVPTARTRDDFIAEYRVAISAIPGGEANNMVDETCNIDWVIACMPDCFDATSQIPIRHRF